MPKTAHLTGWLTPEDLLLPLVALGIAVLLVNAAQAAPSDLLIRFVGAGEPASLNPDADSFGNYHETISAIELLGAGKRIGWAFLTSDYVSTTGYSGKPIQYFFDDC